MPLRAAEIVAIARALALPPLAFARLGPSAVPAHAFRLAPAAAVRARPLASTGAEQPLRPVLRKASGRCCFAFKVHGGRHVCGLPGLVPSACRVPVEPLAPDDEARREASVRERWHAALDAGSHAMPEEVFFEFLFDAVDAAPLDGEAPSGGEPASGLQRVGP